MMPALLSVIIAFAIFAGAGIEVVLTNLSVVGRSVDSQQAFNIAEAGLNYYLWHLNHNSTDYKDGLTTPATPDAALGYGPYTHNYIDKNGSISGTYTLWVKAPTTGSTVVTVRSIGQAAGTKIKRTVQAQIGSPSFASYGVVSDSSLWFGSTETADGPVHSNQGIRMDGTNTSTASSASTTYVPSTAYGGDGSSKNGVWCNTSVTTPVDCASRTKSDWVYPVTSIDFNQVSNSLCTIKKVALAAYAATSAIAGQANACTQVPSTRTNTYLPQRSTTFNLTKGYLIQLNANGTYDLSYVNAENDLATNYSTALTLQSVATNIAIPAAGVIYAEDNVWVRTNPNFKGRVTVAAGRLSSSSSSTYANIVIADQMLYSTKNGTDAIGLVAQDAVIMAPYGLPRTGSFDFEVDAAVLTQSGEVWYPGVYRSDSNRCTRGWANSNQRLIFYGSVATRQTWTWSWLDGSSQCGDAALVSGTGYVSGPVTNVTQYDYNLKYSPPPSYPITAGYNFLSWREVLTKP
ncbi:MAG: hypothetical protein JWM81_516 [Candidatus Saccharibacteria bacterium]|nr:hypothetical protein [Candidatus Saccharibacteria bacterium]